MDSNTTGSHTRSCWICYSTDPFSSYYHSSNNNTQSSSNWYNISSWISQSRSILQDQKNDANTCKSEWVQPCPCKGSMQWVHQSCLLAWTKVQLANLQRHSFTPVLAEDISHESWWTRIWPISSLRSPPRASYYIHEQLCCPQCKTSYKFQEIPTGIILASLEAVESLTGRALVFISASGVALSIYTLMWVYGYFALRCLMGGEDMYQLMVPLHHHIPWTEPPDSLQYSTNDWTRQAVFICTAIPVFPISLFISSNPTFSRLGPFLLHYFAHLYYPNALDPRGSSYFIMAWILPLSWNLYRFSRIILNSNIFRRNTIEINNADSQVLDSLEENNTLERLEADVEDDSSEDDDSQLNETNSESTPISTTTQTTQSVEFAPSSVRINLLSITQILCWPFASAICGRIVLILASRLSNTSHAIHKHGPIDRAFMRIADWIINISPMTRNSIAGFCLVAIKDIISSVMEHYRDKKAKSRSILPYYSSQ